MVRHINPDVPPVREIRKPPTPDEVDALTARAAALLDELRTVLSEISETLPPQRRNEAV
jgi:hypothetical protein